MKPYDPEDLEKIREDERAGRRPSCPLCGAPLAETPANRGQKFLACIPCGRFAPRSDPKPSATVH